MTAQLEIERTVGLQKNPNPQGKGMVPILRDWATVRPDTAVAKSPDIFLRDYCISSLVLAAKFRLKPVMGKTYFLYVRDSEWMMSLIAPREWGESQPGAFLGCCRLRADMTWKIGTSEAGETDELARESAQGFVAALTEQNNIVEHLPFYVSELPYYQRLLATALASSLQRSLPTSVKGAESLFGSLRIQDISII